jgi:hypothetical protein
VSRVQIRDEGVIFNASLAPENQRNCAFTSTTLLKDGTILVAFRNASGRDAPDGRLRVMRSRDQGAHWETLHPGLTATIDGVEGNLYGGFFTELPDGRVLGAFVWVDRSNPELSFVNPETTGLLPMRALLADSTDGGVSWTPFQALDLSPQTGCSVTGPVFLLPGRTLALPYESWKDYDDASFGRHIASLRISSDGGKTWPEMIPVASDPAERTLYWDQRFAAHPETGDLVAMFWTHDRETETDIENHIAWGSPDGRTWTVPIAAGWRGQHCQPLALGGDRLAAIYVHRHDPPSLRIVLSEDFGRTWDRANEFTFFESRSGAEAGAGGERAFEDFWQDMMTWSFGHPRGVLLPDGDLFIAFYAGDDASTTMRWVRLAVDR